MSENPLRDPSLPCTLLGALALVSLFGPVACQEDPTQATLSEPPSASEEMGDQEDPDLGTASTSPDMGSGGAGQDMPPECAPLAQCPADVCGMLEDGCGGMLDCGACACQAGTLTLDDDACGPCGLGQLECASGHTGTATCSLPSRWLGLTDPLSKAACDEALVHVDPTYQEASDGSAIAPYRTYAEALDAADPGDVILIRSVDSLHEQVVVRDGISVIGGMSRPRQDRWVHVPGQITTFEAPPAGQDNAIGLWSTDISTDTWVAHLSVRAPRAEPGYSSYGMLAVDAPGLHLHRVHLQGSPAGDGLEGRPGARGVNGVPGHDGALYVRAEAGAPDPSPTPGGLAPECPEAAGGEGGRGERLCLGAGARCVDNGSLHMPAIISTDGAPGHGPAGGDGGARTHSPTDTMGTWAQSGSDATAPGAPGLHGGPATPSGQWIFAQDPNASQYPMPSRGPYWTPSRGETGQPGEHGSGGGGGGGTRYALAMDSIWMGASGGSGGSGGCAGQGGQGGQTGHASFGALLVRSDLSLEHVTIEGDQGGEGATGGRGGDGGAPAEGGTRGRFLEGFVDQGPLGGSGEGGWGTVAGDGGDGGPGAGGDSYGLYCLDSNPTADRQTSSWTAGQPGQGVTGAPAGRALDQVDCF